MKKQKNIIYKQNPPQCYQHRSGTDHTGRTRYDYLRRLNNECFVKELGEMELISLNPKSKNIPLNETARCMGRVVGKL